jgi:hypothetical protein
MSWALDRRLDYIDWRLARHGEVRRQHLMTAFGVSMPQASVDLNAFIAAHPGAMAYDKSRKLYAPAKMPYRSRRDISCDDEGRLVITIDV